MPAMKTIHRLYFCKRSCGKPLSFLFSKWLLYKSLQLQARIFISPLRDQDLLVRDEKLNLVVQLVLKKKRMQMLLDGKFRLVVDQLLDLGL